MNLLRIQDALKNASDDQLMGLLRTPDATAPSYLVLSEIKRRKDMRAQQPEEPQGTVAEDLAKESTYDDQGIRSLKTPGYEEEAQRADPEGIQGMRRGGVVRMQDGGTPPRPLQDLSASEIDRYLDLSRQRQRLGFPMTGPGASPYTIEELMGQRMALEEISNLNPSEINRSASLIPQNLPGSLEVPPAATSTGVSSPSQSAPPSAAVASADPGAAPVRAEMPPTVVTAAAPGAAAGAAAGRPGSAGGIGALGSGGSPDFDRLYAANMARFPGLPADLEARMKAMRTKPEEERSKALNMSLIEAGLRMMASKNPSLLGSIGESAVPAVQSYAQQQAQIRKDQREDIKDELSVAQANLARAYYAGQITAAQYRTAVSELGANARAALAANAQERVAERTAAGLESRERIAADRIEAQERNAVRAAFRSALASDPEYKALSEQIGMQRSMLSTANESQRSQIQSRVQQLERARSNRESQIRGLYSSEDPLGLRTGR